LQYLFSVRLKKKGFGRYAFGHAEVNVRNAMKPTISIRPEIDKMVRRIVKRFRPEKIILFGSHARGEAGPDSDVDLLVVMKVEGSKRDKQLELRSALRDIHVPKDIILSKPEEFQWRKEVVGTIERPAYREGRVLYDRT
jgi:predicted nucleotidyltransferase